MHVVSPSLMTSSPNSGLIEILEAEPLPTKVDLRRVPVLPEQRRQGTHEEYLHIGVEAAMTDVY